MSDSQLAPPRSVANIPVVEESPFWFGIFRPSQLNKVPAQLDWLWDGYLARGQITLLTGQWKIGKTALLSCLLARLGAGGRLADRDVHAGNAIVISEEGAGLWRDRCQAFGIGEHARFAFRPFLQRPDDRQWELFVKLLLDLHHREPLQLLVIDPLAMNWPCADENHVAGVTAALRPLREVAQQNIAVLLLHHPRKERLGGGREARGSGAMSAFVDILIEMRWYAGPDSEDRRRRLMAWLRHDATPREWLIELAPDGRDYVRASSDAGGGSLAAKVRQLLGREPDLTVRELLERWPDSPLPSAGVLYRELSRAVRANELICTRPGNRYAPYRYRLREPASEAAAPPAPEGAGGEAA